jgi:hypothetical protein
MVHSNVCPWLNELILAYDQTDLSKIRYHAFQLTSIGLSMKAQVLVVFHLDHQETLTKLDFARPLETFSGVVLVRLMWKHLI